MTDGDRKQFSKLLTTVYGYYRRDLSPLVMDLWWNGCCRYELDTVRAVLSEHMQDPDRGSYLPLIADVTRALRGTATDRAAIAWGRVREAMESVGAYTDVVFDDPAIHCAVADLGGWPRLCRVKLEDLGYEQHRFVQSYRAYTKALPPQYPRVLIGDRAPDTEWERRGLKPPAPKACGDRALARLVHQGKATALQLKHQP